jgi:hypothetical protein
VVRHIFEGCIVYLYNKILSCILLMNLYLGFSEFLSISLSLLLLIAVEFLGVYNRSSKIGRSNELHKLLTIAWEEA